MKTLQEAWDWYQCTKTNLERMWRLGRRHWNTDALQGTSIRSDERFKHLEADEILQGSSKALEPIDDLAVLVLFSVFESAVREHLERTVKPLAAKLNGTVLEYAADLALDGIRQGSFANQVLEPLKTQGRIASELCEEVNQVRKYRNWVAHGKRGSGDKVDNVTARLAFERLKECLDVLGIAVEAKLDSSAHLSEERYGDSAD